MAHAQSLTAKKVAVTGFGAALASMGAASSADAAIVELSFSPASFGTFTFRRVSPQTSGGGQVAGSFSVSNYFFQSTSTFRFSYGSRVYTYFSFTTFVSKRLDVHGGMTFAELNLGDAVDGALLDTRSVNEPRGGKTYFGFSSDDGKFGWVLYDFGTSYDSGTSFVTGYLNNVTGGAINVGQTEAISAVPGPAALPLLGTGLLAMGAAGIRRRRKELQAA
ncbi:VPLPA-CTERM sorting domain-containing protein [Actibacterium lipolyticum]|uniref:PEP-CTERM protein-sorting domain-containing protein n=1 Tax=Actibacterium lipolyticum TaxID=1524263 RepID=A0A238KGC3_9RHOB|nr:VPLPA-CTERM sorting domain-containing protein [Actibacterium lipolyticum]SMX41893.1 hypothetical protein COL8621_01847 [Actibacterium lipolyticum]